MLTLKDVYANANCSDHRLNIDESLLEGAETIVALGRCYCGDFNNEYKTCESYCDSESFAIGRLKDGRYIVIDESSDTSGHGCQCNGSASLHETLDDAIRLGLQQEHRDAYAKVTH